MDGLIVKQEKPSNTEVLGELINPDKLHFITNLSDRNVKGLFKLGYFMDRLREPERDSTEILQKNLEKCLEYKCSVHTKKTGNRADQIVDALKHIIEDENQDDLKSIADSIKK